MSIKDFFVKQLLKKQLKNLPPEQQEMITKLVTENPELFKKISEEVERLVKHEGKDQQVATFEVMRKYQGELQKIMMGR